MEQPGTAWSYRADLLLRRVAVAETVTLVLLLVNLVTVHTVWITRPVGAVHGLLVLAYTPLCLVTRWTHRWPWWFAGLVAVPAVGPLLLLERCRRDGSPAGAGGREAALVPVPR